jgi:hypothetical protein
MGIHVNALHWIVGMLTSHRVTGRVCTLGVQQIEPDLQALRRIPAMAPVRTLDASSVFAALGFSATEALDITNAEGAEHLVDLNDDELPAALAGRFGFVVNGGTLEHIFHVPNALTNISKLLGPGGAVLHLLPCHNWVDHGFYQVSPTLMFDYYTAAGFTILGSALATYAPTAPSRWLVRSMEPGDVGTGLAGAFRGCVALHLFLAERGRSIDERPRPRQSLYAAHAARNRLPNQPLPYLITDGRLSDVPVVADVVLNEVRPESGHCWVSEFRRLRHLADGAGTPMGSTLSLYEDSRLLGPAHALHDTIRQQGAGAYSHWDTALYFSTSDNSSPRTNGRRYRAVIYDVPQELT